MLIRFEVGNFRSIHRPVELSFTAVDADRPGVREAIPGTPVVPVVGVYGANASGKSNVLGGLVWLQEAVRSSLVHWDDGIPVEPFAFASGMGAPMTCAVDVARNGVRYEYICQVDASRVQYEALYEYPRRKRRLVFEREDNGLAMNRRHSEYAAVKTLMTPRSLALSVLRRFDPLTAVQAVADTFNTMRFADQHAMPLRWWSAPPGAIRLFEGGAIPGIPVRGRSRGSPDETNPSSRACPAPQGRSGYRRGARHAVRGGSAPGTATCPQPPRRVRTVRPPLLPGVDGDQAVAVVARAAFVRPRFRRATHRR